MQPRTRYFALLLATISLGAAVRFAVLHLPHAIIKYGGSALWAAAIFWFISALAPRMPASSRTAASLAISFAIECFKLVRTPALDAFRLTLPGKLLLGRFFSTRDLLAYTVGITVAAAIDHALLAKKPNLYDRVKSFPRRLPDDA